MPRKCLCCTHQERKKLDETITAGLDSARAIAARFRVSPHSVLNHRRHLTGDLAASYSKHAGELEQLLARVDRLIKLLELHLKNKPRTALSLDWIRESRDQRGWMTFRTKVLGKIAPAKGDGQRREGDRYSVVFIAPDGKPAQIPLSVYRAIPSSAFEQTDGNGTLATQANAPQEAVKNEQIS
jgi:hypothetical protein